MYVSFEVSHWLIAMGLASLLAWPLPRSPSAVSSADRPSSAGRTGPRDNVQCTLYIHRTVPLPRAWALKYPISHPW